MAMWVANRNRSKTPRTLGVKAAMEDSILATQFFGFAVKCSSRPELGAYDPDGHCRGW